MITNQQPKSATAMTAAKVLMDSVPRAEVLFLFVVSEYWGNSSINAENIKFKITFDFYPYRLIKFHNFDLASHSSKV